MIQEQIPKTSELIFLLLYIIIQFAIGTVITIISTIFCYVIATKSAIRGVGTAIDRQNNSGYMTTIADDGTEIRTPLPAPADAYTEADALATLAKIRRIDQLSFLLMFLCTGASHGAIYSYIAM